MKHKQIFIRISLVLLLLALAYAANHYGWLQTALDDMQALGPWAVPAFVAVYALTAVLFVPSFVFTLGGGVLFGFWGIPLALLGTGLGSACAFSIGRTFARPYVSKKFAQHKTFCALDAAVKKKGWQIIVLARLSPIFPFSIGNYAFGLTALPLPVYAVSSMLGTIPSASVYTYLGVASSTLASNSTTQRGPLEWGLLAGGCLATILLARLIQKQAKAALDEQLNPQ